MSEFDMSLEKPRPADISGRQSKCNTALTALLIANVVVMLAVFSELVKVRSDVSQYDQLRNRLVDASNFFSENMDELRDGMRLLRAGGSFARVADKLFSGNVPELGTDLLCSDWNSTAYKLSDILKELEARFMPPAGKHMTDVQYYQTQVVTWVSHIRSFTDLAKGFVVPPTCAGRPQTPSASAFGKGGLLLNVATYVNDFVRNQTEKTKLRALGSVCDAMVTGFGGIVLNGSYNCAAPGSGNDRCEHAWAEQTCLKAHSGHCVWCDYGNFQSCSYFSCRTPNSGPATCISAGAQADCHNAPSKCGAFENPCRSDPACGTCTCTWNGNTTQHDIVAYAGEYCKIASRL